MKKISKANVAFIFFMGALRNVMAETCDTLFGKVVKNGNTEKKVCKHENGINFN